MKTQLLIAMTVTLLVVVMVKIIMTARGLSLADDIYHVALHMQDHTRNICFSFPDYKIQKKCCCRNHTNDLLLLFSHPPKAIIYDVIIYFIDILFQRKLLACRENEGPENAYNVYSPINQILTSGKTNGNKRQWKNHL